MPTNNAFVTGNRFLTLSLLFFLLITTSGNSFARSPLSIFQTGSYVKILKQNQTQPFLMVLWSQDCPPCFQELAMLGKLKQSYPELQLVLVSTDSPADETELLKILDENGVATADLWVFSQAASSRLRYEVDSLWYGELPRSYFFDDRHVRQAVSGALDQEQVKSWLKNIKQGRVVK